MRRLCVPAGRHEDSEVSDCEDDEDAHPGNVSCRSSAKPHQLLLIKTPGSSVHTLTCLLLQICTTLGALPGEVGGAEFPVNATAFVTQ